MTGRIEALVRRHHGLGDEDAPPPEAAKVPKPVKLTVTTGEG